MDEILQAIIQEHSKRPRHFGKLPVPPARHHLAVNPLCGDEVDVYANIQDGVIQQAQFDGAGCAISQATASLLVSQCQQQPVTEVQRWLAALEVLLTTPEAPQPPLPPALEMLLPLHAYPRRVPCALCSVQALKTVLGAA